MRSIKSVIIFLTLGFASVLLNTGLQELLQDGEWLQTGHHSLPIAPLK